MPQPYGPLRAAARASINGRLRFFRGRAGERASLFGLTARRRIPCGTSKRIWLMFNRSSRGSLLSISASLVPRLARRPLQLRAFYASPYSLTTRIWALTLQEMFFPRIAKHFPALSDGLDGDLRTASELTPRMARARESASRRWRCILTLSIFSGSGHALRTHRGLRNACRAD
jgi:hypothetical protein